MSEDKTHIVVNLDGYNKLVDERDRLAAEIAEAKRSIDFWRTTAERRGDEIKAIYIQQSKEDTCEKQS